jgi:hypothetical protein
MTDAEKAIVKLRRPPGVHNWVRNIRRRTDDFAQSLYNTAVNGPRHSLKQVTDVIRNVVTDGLSDDQAYASIDRISNARTRAYGFQILRALLPHIRANAWKGVQVFKNLVEWYPVAANVSVPVRPTFVVNDGTRIIPYFVICWVEVRLSDYQKRILTTLIRESIMSLEEFEESEAVIVCVPRHSFSKTERYVLQWNLSDFPDLTSDEKTELFDRYGRALNLAEAMIVENLG